MNIYPQSELELFQKETNFKFIDDLMIGESEEEIREAQDNFRSYLNLIWRMTCRLDREGKLDDVIRQIREEKAHPKKDDYEEMMAYVNGVITFCKVSKTL